MISPTRHTLTDICSAILFASDSYNLKIAYDTFFKYFSQALIMNYTEANISIVEEVVLKIIQEDIFLGTTYEIDLKALPFFKLVSIANKQRIINSVKYNYGFNQNGTCSIKNLEKYIMYNIEFINERDFKYKNKLLKMAFHKNLVYTN